MADFKENDTVYTPCGYGIIAKQQDKESKTNSENNMESSSGATEKQVTTREKQEIQEMTTTNVQVNLKWGGVVFIDPKDIRKKVTINIKTFYGSKKKVSIECDINTTIQQLKTLLLDSHLENAKTLYNLRLIYPMGTLQELNIPQNTIEQYKIPHNANLILLTQVSFTWDPNCKGTGIKLSNNNLTASKLPEVDYQTMLGNLVIESGRHYWEIRIDQFTDEEDLFVGIAKKDISLYGNPLESKVFWGYMCLCGKKFGSDGVLVDYGYSAKKNDTIGVLLEYKAGFGTLSFYKNGTKFGTAFSNLTGAFYPAVCMHYGDIQVTLDPKAPMPLSQSQSFYPE